MICIQHQHKGYDKAGNEVIDAWLMASSVPNTFPSNGDGIECTQQGSGLYLKSTQVFAPGSFLQICGRGANNGKIYFMGEDGGWYVK